MRKYDKTHPFVDDHLATYDLYHYLHRKNKELFPHITRTLQEMEMQGVIREIRADYIEALLRAD